MVTYVILGIVISSFLIIILRFFPIKKIKELFRYRSKGHSHLREHTRGYLETQQTPKGYLTIAIEIIISALLFFLIDPVIEFIYLEKYLHIKELNPHIISIDFIFSPSRRMGDKLVLYISLSVIIIGYMIFKYTIYQVTHKSLSRWTLSNIVRLRMLIIAFMFLGLYGILVPLIDGFPEVGRHSDIILFILISASFLPLIIILASVSTVGISQDINVQRALREALIIFVSFPILCWGGAYFCIKVLGIKNQYVIIYIIQPYLFYFLSKFSSFKNLKKLDEYF